MISFNGNQRFKSVIAFDIKGRLIVNNKDTIGSPELTRGGENVD